MQYSIRVYLLLHTKLLFRSSKAAWPQGLVRRLESARSGFSFTRYYASELLSGYSDVWVLGKCLSCSTG